MRKIRNFILMLALAFIPSVVFAQAVEPDYEVINSYISADIDIVGSVHIREAIVVKGTLNGFRRTLKYKNTRLADWEAGKVDFANSSIYNARWLSLSKISAKSIKKEDIGWNLLDLDYDKFEEVSSSKKGSTKEYTTEEIDGGQDVKIYNVNEGGYMVYYFDYFVDQVAVMHNDCAEVYFTFFMLDSDDVGEVNIQVTTPGYSKDDVFRVWAHGPMSGEIRRASDKQDENGEYLYNGAVANLKNYKAGEAIEIRMTFDKNLLSTFASVLNNSEMDALKEIIDVETERAQETNRQRTFARVAYYSIFGSSIVYLLGLIGLTIYMYIKYDKEHKIGFDFEYYREFTGDYNVEVVEYLMKEDITTDAFSASVMNLIYKKNIDIEENIENKKNITLVEKSRENLSDAEEVIMSLFFDNIGKDGRVTLKEIEKFSGKYSTAEKFMQKYNTWRSYVIADAKREEFFESLTTPRACATIYFILGIIIFFLMLFANIEPFWLAIVVLVASIAFVIYIWAFKKWSRKGREHYLKWNAFKKFLLDFGTMEEKEIPEVKLWDKYLVYATVLGVAKEVQKAMNVRLSSMDENDILMAPRSFTYSDFYLMNSISHSMNTAKTQSMNTISLENAKSSMSSGSGFGGGFSGGGGFAGGGGGGGGF